MTLKQILNLDCREDENVEILQERLKKIKPLSKTAGIVPFEKIERVITLLSKKYNMRIREFVPDVWANEKETIWRSILIDENTLKTIDVIYGLSVYEVFAKTAICMYDKRNSIGLRKEREG